MADEIEKYLVAKLSHAIKEIESTDQHLLARLAHLPFKFQELKKSLEPSTSAAANGKTVSKISREKLYSLNNLVTEWQMQSKKQTPYSPEALSFICKFARNFDRIKGELSGKVDRMPQGGDGSMASNVETTPPSSHEASPTTESEAFRWSTPEVDATKVYGLEDKAKSLQISLIMRKDDAQFKAIAIVGMRGIGKTTLCQLIFNKQEFKSHFLPRIWVCMSKNPNDDQDTRKGIVKRMLRCLGVEEEIINSANDHHGLKGLLFALRLQLVGKRYLIVLDDVWSTDEQYKDFCSSLAQDEKCREKLACGLPKGSGGTVIITSRTEEVVKNMVGEENLHRLLPLSDPESWLIFKDSVEKDGKKLSRDLKSLKEIIIKKCAGLPLAAKMMGQIAHEQIQPQDKQAVSENHEDESHPELEQQLQDKQAVTENHQDESHQEITESDEDESHQEITEGDEDESHQEITEGDDQEITESDENESHQELEQQLQDKQAVTESHQDESHQEITESDEDESHQELEQQLQLHDKQAVTESSQDGSHQELEQPTD